ncbi:MAG: hypothetical protein AABY18_00735 [Candidatus Thermoplasmatota archaeon]
MRFVVVLVAVATLAGCLQTGPGESPVEPLIQSTVLQKIDTDGMYNVTELVGLAAGADATWTWDPLQAMMPDSFRLLLVQVAQPGLVNVTMDQDLHFDTTSLTGEQVPSDSVCASDYVQLPAPGDFYLGRSQGTDVSYAPFNWSDGDDQVNRYSAGGSTGGGGGSGASSGHSRHEAELRAGEWVLITAGLTGYPADQAAADGHWTFTIRADGPLRFVEVLPSGYLCGSGFERLGGQHVPAPAHAHVGGSGSIEALYGAFFMFCAPAIDQRNAVPLNSADVDFLGGRTHLFAPGYTQFNSTDRGSISLTVQQWVGNPFWSMQGFWVPPLLGLDVLSLTYQELCTFVP